MTRKTGSSVSEEVGVCLFSKRENLNLSVNEEGCVCLSVNEEGRVCLSVNEKGHVRFSAVTGK